MNFQKNTKKNQNCQKKKITNRKKCQNLIEEKKMVTYLTHIVHGTPIRTGDDIGDYHRWFLQTGHNANLPAELHFSLRV